MKRQHLFLAIFMASNVLGCRAYGDNILPGKSWFVASGVCASFGVINAGLAYKFKKKASNAANPAEHKDNYIRSEICKDAAKWCFKGATFFGLLGSWEIFVDKQMRAGSRELQYKLASIRNA